MLDTFKVQLKTYLQGKKVNLSKERIDAYAAKLDKKNPDITDPAEIDKAIADMDELIGFADIARQDDKVRTLEAKTKPSTKTDESAAGDLDDDEEENAAATKQRDRTPAWAKQLMQEVQTLKAEKQQATIADKLKGHDKLKGIPAAYYKGRALPAKDDDINSWAEEVATDYKAFKQELANEGFAQSSRPGGGHGSTSPKEAVSPEVKAFVEKNKQQTEKK